jgi:hypothetical protein
MTGLRSWPPELPVVSGDNLDEARARCRELEVEIGRLVAADKANRWRGGLSPEYETRLGWCRDTVATMSAAIKVIEKFQRAA